MDDEPMHHMMANPHPVSALFKSSSSTISLLVDAPTMRLDNASVRLWVRLVRSHSLKWTRDKKDEFKQARMWFSVPFQAERAIHNAVLA